MVNGRLVRTRSGPICIHSAYSWRSALFLGYGILVNRVATTKVEGALGLATLAAAVGLYLSGSRSTLFFVLPLLISWGNLGRAIRSRGWRRAIPLLAVIAVDCRGST